MIVEWGYALALVIAGFISVGVAVGNWPRRAFHAGRALLAFLLCLSWWSFTYALFWLRIPGPTPFFWIDLTYFSVVAVPIALTVFTLQFTGRGRYLTRLNMTLLLVVPILTLVLLWTDPLHGLFFAGTRVPGQGVIFDGGLGFYLNLVFGYGLILVSIVMLLQAFGRSTGLYRSQILAVLVGIFIPILVNVLSLLGASPFPNLDLTPITFTITGIFFAYALFRLGLLDIVPIARHALVEQMSDGLIVLDGQERVVDINPSARSILELAVDPIGQTGAKVFGAWPQLGALLLQMRPASQELLLGGMPQRTAEVFITPLYDQAGEFEGRLIVIRDITQRVEVERQLREQIAQNEALQAQLREQNIRDPLTGVFNRRYLEESLHRELANATRKHEPLSVVMLDIDMFKSFNDTYGHAIGDLVLQTVGRILNENTRAGDIVCRYGGDEFVVVLPGATAETARTRVDECRRRFADAVFQVQGKSLRSTLSAGVTIYPLHADNAAALLECADRALYQAKQQGKNLTAVLSSSA
ncbi:MAG: diguanylate cyclase [Anaerolineales bacterium]|nr:MAG: diguanylate cyclase [Anaerolineales bacterium]